MTRDKAINVVNSTLNKLQIALQQGNEKTIFKAEYYEIDVIERALEVAKADMESIDTIQKELRKII